MQVLVEEGQFYCFFCCLYGVWFVYWWGGEVYYWFGNVEEYQVDVYVGGEQYGELGGVVVVGMIVVGVEFDVVVVVDGEEYYVDQDQCYGQYVELVGVGNDLLLDVVEQ